MLVDFGLEEGQEVGVVFAAAEVAGCVGGPVGLQVVDDVGAGWDVG